MRPAFLFLDTDVAIQLFTADVAPGVLTPLRKAYGIRPVVVPEVEIELVSNSKFGRRFQPPFRRARANGLIELLDSSNYSNFVNASDELQRHLVGVGHAAIQRRGHAYNLSVGRGEAYTHATAVMMGQPAASNDYSAVTTLAQAGEALPTPVLRTFDLVVFANQVGELTDAQCDDIRDALLNAGEHLPKCWQHASYRDGLRAFVPRLVDPTLPAKGRPGSPGPSYASVLQVRKPPPPPP